jgi:hypothetical protein
MFMTRKNITYKMREFKLRTVKEGEEYLLIFCIYVPLVYVVMSRRKSLSWLGCICTVCKYNELANKEANKMREFKSRTVKEGEEYSS